MSRLEIDVRSKASKNWNKNLIKPPYTFVYQRSYYARHCEDVGDVRAQKVAVWLFLRAIGEVDESVFTIILISLKNGLLNFLCLIRDMIL